MTLLTFLTVLLLGSLPSFASAGAPHAKEGAFSKTIIHKRTDHFIDIEVPAEQAWIGCSDDSQKKSHALMLFYALDGSQSHEFHYQKITGRLTCLEAEREYREIIHGAKTIRLVGHRPSTQKGPMQPVSPRLPSRFTATPTITWWTFSRLQVGGRCKAYFPQDCDLPKNYWSSTMPE